MNKFYIVSYVLFFVAFAIIYIRATRNQKAFDKVIKSVKEQKSIPHFRNKNNALSWLLSQHAKVKDIPVNLLDSSDRTEVVCNAIVSAHLIYIKTKDPLWKEVWISLKENYERGIY
jgi:hypothetical protein